MPFPVILSAPSGAGKTTITRRLLELRDDLGYSVSATTRAPRAGEIDGVSYHFLSREQFEAAIGRGEFAEYATVHGNLYGTLRREVERVMQSGRNVIMDIDVQGAAQFSATFPESVKIFVLPPSGETLVSRLRARGTEDRGAVRTRLRDAIGELGMIGDFDYVIVNDELERAVSQTSGVIDAENLRRDRCSATPDLTAEIIAALTLELDQT